MLREAVEGIQADFSGKLEFEQALSKSVYYRIGGPAEVLATPRSFDDLKLLHQIIRKTGCPFFILGWGSNLLVSDAGIRGVVIRMKHLFTGIEECDENQLKLGASLGASSLLKAAGEKGYGDLERLTGIPGSVGGMVAMNAGTHLGEIGPLLNRTEFVNFSDETLEVKTRVHQSGDFSYRKNHFLKAGDVVTHTFLRYQTVNPDLVRQSTLDLYQRRKASQPVEYPSCGSVFMNPKESGLSAWQVVDRLNLRGHQIGQAQISEKHPNFIVNLGGALASDVQQLIELVQVRALKEMQIEMHPEVKFIS